MRGRVLCKRALSHASPVLQPMGVMILLRSSRAPFRLRGSFVVLLLLLLLSVLPAAAQPTPGDVLIRLDERQIRVAGIDLARAEPECARAVVGLVAA